MYSLSILGDATNGEITSFINQKAKGDVENEFDPNVAKNLGKMYRATKEGKGA